MACDLPDGWDMWYSEQHLEALKSFILLFFFDVLSFNNSSSFSDLCLSKEFPTLEFHYLLFIDKE